MIFFSGCKINLGLKVLGKLADGYHSLSTIFLPVPFPFSDVIEITASKSFEFVMTGIKVTDIKPSDNICVKVYELLKEKYSLSQPVKIHLHKNIPIGAGLGGGSANGVNTLKGLNDFFNLHMSEKEMLELSETIGSDCPFFVHNQVCYGEGRGEILTPIDINILNNKYLLIILPNISISTKDSFGQLKLYHLDSAKLDLNYLEDIHQWKANYINDFETTIFQQKPILADIKASLYHAKAIYASMSGTGSSIYGIFDDEPNWKAFEQYGKSVLVRF